MSAAAKGSFRCFERQPALLLGPWQELLKLHPLDVVRLAVPVTPGRARLSGLSPSNNLNSKRTSILLAVVCHKMY